MPVITVNNIGTDPTTGVIQPGCKVTAQVLLHDFWDSTNKRYKSGVVVTTIDQVKWTGTTASGETATITAQPPNYQEDCNDQVTLRPDITSVTDVDNLLKHVTAINYGMPDSSAVLEPDGTISLVDVTFYLNANAFTPIASLVSVIVTYTTTFTEISPYSTIGGTSYSADLAIGNGSAADWGMATSPVASGFKSIALQLQSLEWSVIPGENSGMLAPSFQLSNPARNGGAVVANYNTPLAQSAGRSLSYHDYYTCIFAVNDGKLDANATPVQAPGGALYDLCNFGLTATDASSQDTATATLTYKVEVTTK
jgi:hypothetical protein